MYVLFLIVYDIVPLLHIWLCHCLCLFCLYVCMNYTLICYAYITMHALLLSVIYAAEVFIVDGCIHSAVCVIQLVAVILTRH